MSLKLIVDKSGKSYFRPLCNKCYCSVKVPKEQGDVTCDCGHVNRFVTVASGALYQQLGE